MHQIVLHGALPKLLCVQCESYAVQSLAAIKVRTKCKEQSYKQLYENLILKYQSQKQIFSTGQTFNDSPEKKGKIHYFNLFIETWIAGDDQKFHYFVLLSVIISYIDWSSHRLDRSSTMTGPTIRQFYMGQSMVVILGVSCCIFINDCDE